MDALFSMSLEDLLQVEVIGATRTEQSLLTVPSSVTVYTHEEIKRLGVGSVEELANLTAGFQVRRSGGGQLDIVTRGNQFGNKRDVLFLIDGQRINNDWAGGVANNRIFIPLGNVEKVEFIRGAGSALYGSNAFSAVVNITTLKENNEVSGGGNSQTQYVNVNISSQSQPFNYSAFIKGVADSGVQYSGLTDTIGNGESNSKDPYDLLDMYVQGHYENASLYFSHNARTSDGFYISRRLSQRNYRNAWQSHLRADYDLSGLSDFQSRIALSFMKSKSMFFIELKPKGGAFNQDDLVGTFEVLEDTPSIEWFNSYLLNKTDSLQFGLEFRRPKISKVRIEYNYDIINNPPQTPFYNPSFYEFLGGKETSRDIFGVYAQYQANILDELLLTTGIRYDDYSDFGDSLNPRFALVYNGYNDTALKFLYSKAYRAPSRFELDLINNGVTLGNPDLKPERIESYELVYIKQLNRHAISMNLYLNSVKDIIIVTSNESGANIRGNAAQGEFQGIELEYMAQPDDSLQIRSSFSRVISKPDFSVKASQNIMSGSLNYQHNQYNFNVSGFYHSSVRSDSFGVFSRLPSYRIFNAHFVYKASEQSSFFLKVKNLFDIAYFVPTTASGLSIDVPNRGRETMLGFELEF